VRRLASSPPRAPAYRFRDTVQIEKIGRCYGSGLNF